MNFKKFKVMKKLLFVLLICTVGCKDKTTCEKIIDQRMYASDRYLQYHEQDARTEISLLDSLIFKCGCDTIR